MKSRFLKICSWILTFVLLVNMLPMSVFAEEFREAIADTEAEAVTASEPAQVVDEIVENRTEFSKEFLLSNGLHMAVLYPDAVHYKAASGWKEIDNTLVTKENGTLANTAGVWDVRFPQKLDGTESVSIEKDGYTLTFTMAGELNSSGAVRLTAEAEASSAAQMQLEKANAAQVQVRQIDIAAQKEAAEHPETVPVKLRSGVAYNEVYENTHITYDLESNRVKESVILDAFKETLRGYRYTLNVGEMLPVLEADGQITLYDKTGKNAVMVMPAPYLLDAAGEYNEDIQVQLTGTGSVRTLTYLLPRQWLAEESRSWPVILDPVIDANLSVSNIDDRTVTEHKTYSATWGMNSCGYDHDTGIQRFYLKYNALPALTSSDVILDATVTLYKEFNSSISSPVEVRSVAGVWDEDTITWANKPDMGEYVEDYIIAKADGKYTWTVTDIVRGWYTGENTGMVFRCDDSVENGNTTHFRQFSSCEYGTSYYRPTLQIFFRNDNGLESYWDYTSVSAGRAGAGYVNNYTGSLTWVRTDMGFAGNRMPVTISRVYNMNEATVPTDDNNSNDTAGNYFSVGNGWRTNFNQTVYRWSENSSYYIWEDEDGTDHYFEPKNGKYKDEDSLELELTVNGSGSRTYCIKNKTGDCHYFDAQGRLTAIENNQQTKSTITVEYVSGDSKQISKVTDGVGRTYRFVYSGGLLESIRFMEAADGTCEYAISYGYTDSKLTTVTYADGKACTYTYNAAGILTSVQDCDEYRVDITHSAPADKSWQPYKVTGLSESDGDSLGGALSFEYAHNQTVITDHDQNKKVLQFNDNGNLTSTQDDEGRAQYAQFAKTNKDDTGKANQLTARSRLQTTVTNLMKDGSFEGTTGATGWTFSATGATLSRSTEKAYAGQASMKLDYSGITKKTYAFGPSVQLQPGETVSVSAYAMAAAGDFFIALRRAVSGARIVGEAVPVNGCWNRIQVQYTNKTEEAISVRASFGSSTVGVYYVDCLQIEKTTTASRCNLIENGDFSFGGTPALQWTGSGLETGDALTTVSDTAAPHLSSNVFSITGDPQKNKQLTYTLNKSGTTGDNYVFSGWALAENAVPEQNRMDEDNPRVFNITLTLHYTDGTTKEAVAKFNPGSNTWQYTAGGIVAEKDYSSITLSLCYERNANTVYFDGIGLFKEVFSTSYTYDDDGNLISVVDLQKQTTSYDYDQNSNLTQVIQDNKAKMTYTYDDYHNVTKATTEEGLEYEFQYDTYGNNIRVFTAVDGVTMESTATYSSDGNRMVSSTDALGNKTLYGYNEVTNMLEWVQYPEDDENNRTEYTYDSMYRMASVTAAYQNPLQPMSVQYGYENDNLTSIRTPTTDYGFTYGDFDLRTGVTVGGVNLASYSYTDDRNHYLSALDYGNGNRVQYTYDDEGRVIQQTYEDEDTVTYLYDNDGALSTVIDSESGITTTYYYDFTDRTMKYVETGTNFSHIVGYEYDVKNNLTKVKETINGTETTTQYGYDNDNRVISATIGDTAVAYTYDSFGRGSQQVTKHGETTVKTDSYTFQSKPDSTTTSAQVQKHTVVVGGVTKEYTYEYDAKGNITSISDGTNTVSYTYDSANQLIREEKAGAYRHSWTYDNAGNILTRTEETWENDAWGQSVTVNYTYGNENWRDLLTAYNGETIDYDQIGNPECIDGWNFTWQHGRQLASMTKSGVTWSFTYNADGLRTKRTNGTTTYTYVYNGSQLMQMKKGSNTLDFIYDAAGRPTALTYNGATYYYITNIQGDIVGIVDTTGATVATYTYDAWGNPIGAANTSAIGSLNPLRYRGYVYDTETGLYYLQSRYYNAEIGRFVNGDGFASTGQGVLGNNMFAYCGNNPVIRVDMTGYCYYTAGGQWTHDAWERIGEDARKPDPRYYQGTTPTGLDVYVVPYKDYYLPRNSVKVLDKRDTNTFEGKPDPDIQILNSYKYTDRADQVGILALITQYVVNNPSKHTWKRTQLSLLIEWDAHNDIYQAKENNRCRHVDFNNQDRNESYLGFWIRAFTSQLSEWGII